MEPEMKRLPARRGFHRVFTMEDGRRAPPLATPKQRWRETAFHHDTSPAIQFDLPRVSHSESQTFNLRRICKVKKNIFVILAVMAIAVTAALAGMNNPVVGGKEMYPTKNIIENAVNSADHTTLV